jgi:amino acid permease
MIGSGILAFPYILGKSGSLWFTFNIIFVMSSVFLGSYMLITTGEKMNIYNYSKLAEIVFGPFVKKCLDVGIVLASMGMILGYLNGKVLPFFSLSYTFLFVICYTLVIKIHKV